ncbi:MAG TPA: cysteine desulfurase CsdA, partial [Gammaproteobacteria bacterium]|nr:cysteine desulfurase CsdA [Gammaproteobacteria bacterium]
MTSVAFDVDAVRADFPILKQQIHGRPLVYLDSGASAQKPEVVIQAVSDYYQRDHSNVHRGVHTLSQRATAAYEAVREKVCTLLNAARTSEIIYVSGTTAAINLVAQT